MLHFVTLLDNATRQDNVSCYFLILLIVYIIPFLRTLVHRVSPRRLLMTKHRPRLLICQMAPAVAHAAVSQHDQMGAKTLSEYCCIAPF